MKGLAAVITVTITVTVYLIILAAAAQVAADEPTQNFNVAQPKAAQPARPVSGTCASEVPAIVQPETLLPAPKSADYRIGNEDILDIAVLQPEQLALTVTVSPDGSITFPYIGRVDVKGKTPVEVQDEIQTRLSDGYLKFPVVSVAVKESRSKKFFVYGEVIRPGTYFLEDNTTVLKAISTAGGFTKYGSSSRVKILRPKAGAAGYDAIKVNMKMIMNGLAQDVVLESGDIVQVEEGIF